MDGYDLPAIEEVLSAAHAELTRPSLIIAKTRIGFGSPNKQDSAEAHGAPLGKEEVILTKRNLRWPEEPDFLVPDDVLLFFRRAGEQGRATEEQWSSLWGRYRQAFPDLAAEWEQMHSEPDPSRWERALPHFEPAEGEVATRVASGKVLAAVIPHLPGLIGGSADLAPSNNTYLKGCGEFRENVGPNIHFGVREHAMGAILNGLALSGSLIPYGGTFLIFSDYMRPAIRLTALMELPVIYVFTHDSIGLGRMVPPINLSSTS